MLWSAIAYMVFVLSAAYGCPAMGCTTPTKVSAFCEEAGLPCISPEDVLRKRAQTS